MDKCLLENASCFTDPALYNTDTVNKFQREQITYKPIETHKSFR